MSADGRAYAWCNLGPLAEGTSSIADSHVQGSGVITVKGTVNLSGIYRPAPGTLVELAYSDGQNWLARIPRRLRVLSVNSNPLGGKTTSLSVGCDLAYFENRKQSPTNPTAREANPDTPEVVWRAAAPAISASYVVTRILTALGLSAAGSIPLTNHSTRQEFDLTAGYVEELGKLASSEGYAVRMNPNGLVEFVNKAPEGVGAGVLITEDDLIDLNPINTGDLAGDAVYARYNSLKLVAPNLDPGPDADPAETEVPKENELEKRNWELDESYGAPQKYVHQWTEYVTKPVINPDGSLAFRQRRDANGQPVFYIASESIENGIKTTVLGGAVMDQVFEVKAYQLRQEIGFIPRTITRTTYDDKDRVTVRKTFTSNQWATDVYAETSYTYDSDGDVLLEKTIEFSPEGPLKTSLGYQGSYISVRGGGYGDQYQSNYREVKYERNKTEGITKTITLSLVPFISTVDGQETMSRYRDAGNQLDQSRLASLLGIAKQLVSAGSEVRISTAREYGLQKRPSESERSADANKKETSASGKKDGTPSLESTAEITWAVGSATSQTSIELSPPYVPDDRIIATGTDQYAVIKSGAASKAAHYARTENRLLLGHRNGNGIQVLPEMLPAEPMGLVFIRLNGCTAAFRVNGTTYNIDPQGVTATTDCLFWGAIDGTVADAWFPLPPGATTLPAPVAITTNANPKPANAIAIPSGFSLTSPNLASLFASLPTAQAPVFPRTVTPGALTKPYHETVTIAAGGGAGAVATALPWIQQPAMEVLAGGGAGAVAELAKELAAGSGSGVIANLSEEVIAESLFAGSGSGAIADLSAATGGGGGSGTALLSFTGSTLQIGRPPYCGFTFTLSESKTIKGVGFYDQGQSGLEAHNYIVLTDVNDIWTPISFDAAGNKEFIVIPNGTAAPLSGPWRRADLSTAGRVLQTGITYALITYMGEDPSDPNADVSSFVDYVVKNATGVSVMSGASYVNNIRDIDGYPDGEVVTNSSAGTAFFGPMIFFE
jgi:hypothetical protein